MDFRIYWLYHILERLELKSRTDPVKWWIYIASLNKRLLAFFPSWITWGVPVKLRPQVLLSSHFGKLLEQMHKNRTQTELFHGNQPTVRIPTPPKGFKVAPSITGSWQQFACFSGKDSGWYFLKHWKIVQWSSKSLALWYVAAVWKLFPFLQLSGWEQTFQQVS